MKKIKQTDERRLKTSDCQRLPWRTNLGIMICFLLLPVFLSAQEKTISLQVKEMKVENIILQLRKTSGYKFLFNHEEIKDCGTKTLDLKNVTVEEAVKAVLQGTGLTYRMEKNIIVIVPEKKRENNAKVKVTGTVTDKAGVPLPGVAIIILQTKAGITTDIDGNFALEIPDDHNTVLLFSMLGMKRQEIMVGNRRSFKIVMEDEAVQLGDVVVTGYQTLSKERSAGSFSVVSGNDIKEKAGLNGSVLESMEGLTPGLSVNFSDGQDKFLIRGITSINSTRSPLFVVDGVPMSADNFENMVNSNDIENITFLKDATAASIWGAQAANGVVVVSTKKGKDTDKKVKISYDGSFTYTGLPDFGYMQYMSSEQLIKSAKEIFDPEFYSWNSITTTNSGISGFLPIVYPHEYPLYKGLSGEYTPDQRDEELARLASYNNRKQIEDLFMQPAFFTNHSLSFMGGGGVHRYYGSFGYGNNQTSNRVRTNKYMLNLKQDFAFTPWLKMDLTVNLAMTDQKHKSMTTVADNILPYMMFKDEQGNALSHSALNFYEPDRLTYEQLSGKSLDYIPAEDNRKGFNENVAFNARVNAGINVRLWKGLSYDGRFQYQRSQEKGEQFVDQDAYEVRRELVEFAEASATPGGSPKFYLPETGGHYTNTNKFGVEWTVRNQLMFDQGFRDNTSQVTALAGMEIRGSLMNNHLSFSRGYDPQTMTYIAYDEKSLMETGVRNPILKSSGSNQSTTGRRHFKDTETELRFVSFYANGAYTYHSRYTLNASVRVDQSNLFGSDPSVQFKPVWAVGAAWNLTEENFVKEWSVLNRLLLRFSYGLGGNSPDPGLGGPYDVMVANVNPGYPGMGYMVVTPANDKLTWEKTRTVNIGADFAILNNRLSGSADVYLKKTTDLLGKVPLNPVTGWVAALANLGTMNNKGFELTLNSHNIQGGFNWWTNFTLTHNKNKIEELKVANGLSPSSVIYENYVEGYAAGSLFAYRWAGLDNMGDPQAYNENGEKVKLSSDLTEMQSMRHMGSMQPLWYGGLTNTFAWKGVELSFMFVYNLGHKMRNDVNSFYSGRITSNLHKDFDKRWRQEGDERFTDIPSYISNTKEAGTRRDDNLYRFSDKQVLNASYVKLRNLSLAYQLPQRICDRLSADRIKVRLQAANLFCLAANKEGIDPESMNFKYGTRTTHYGPSYSVGLTIDFK